MDTTFVAREQSRLLGELSSFLSIPSVSALPVHAADCRRAAEWLRDELQGLGCPTVQIIEGNGHPVVWAESPPVPGRPTLLIYGHYDVQPPDPLDEWHSPPFEPTVRDGNVYARGAGDDKGQVYIHLRAVRDALAEGGLPVNVRFLIEGEEEISGTSIEEYVKANPQALAC